MAGMERTAQHFWQGSGLNEGLPFARILPKALHPSLMAHHNTQGQLLQAWLSHVQRGKDSLHEENAHFFTDFSNENDLLESVFGKCLIPDSDSERLASFCKLLQQNRSNALNDAKIGIVGIESAMMEVKQSIAQIVFLADKDLPLTLTLIDKEDISGSLKRIKGAFESHLLKNLQILSDLEVQHDKVPIQNSSLALTNKKPMVIADMLLTNSGHLNLGLIAIIKQRFFNTKIPLLLHDKELRQTMEILAGSPALQHLFHSITKPYSPYFSSNDLIRVSLKRPPNTPISDRDTKLVVLAALLSDMRQGDVSSCFSTSVAIMMMDALKEKVLNDFISLMSQGKLSREGRSIQKDFIPVMEIGDSTLKVPFTIESSGRIVSGKGLIWESPGIIAACRQLGLEGALVKSITKNAIEKLYEEQNHNLHELIEVTPEALIKLILKIHASPNLDKRELRELKNRSFMAFSAETQCPLLRAWESCLAAMAEAHSNNLVRNKIKHCISLVLEPQWPKPLFSPKANQTILVQTVFENILNNNIQLRYNPQTTVQSAKKGDGHSKIFGAFVLHELKQGRSSLLAKPIETPEKFKKFVLNQLKLTKEVLAKANHEDLQKQLETVDNIHAFISRPDSLASSFVKSSIRCYDPANAKVSDPLTVWEQLEHLPFRDARGDNAVAVYLKATGIAPGQPHVVRPKNAEELLNAFIAFGRTRAQVDHFLEDENPYQRYMVTTTKHAFTLTPEDPSIVGAMDPSQTAEKWIRENIVQFGKTVSELPLTDKLKKKFHEGISQKILVEKSLANSFLNAAKKISSKHDTLSSYGKELLKLLLSMSSEPNVRAENVLSRKLTEVLLYHVLPPETTAKLISTAARIADTNWVDKGSQHLSFSCFYNPLTQSIQLALLDEEGTKLSILKQDEWVNYVPWEMYGVKL